MKRRESIDWLEEHPMNLLDLVAQQKNLVQRTKQRCSMC